MGKLTFTVNGVEMDEPTYMEYLHKVNTERCRRYQELLKLHPETEEEFQAQKEFARKMMERA